MITRNFLFAVLISLACFITRANAQSTNVAVGKIATSNGTISGSDPSNAFDGDESSYWESIHDANRKFVCVDLGKPHTIDKIELIWDAQYYTTAITYVCSNVAVEALDGSGNPLDKDEVKITSAVQINGYNVAGPGPVTNTFEGQGILAFPYSARYVTVIMRGRNNSDPYFGDHYRIKEFKVYGEEIVEATEQNIPGNVAIGKAVTACFNPNNCNGTAEGSSPSNAVDGKSETYWASMSSASNVFLCVDLEKEYEVSKIIVKWEDEAYPDGTTNVNNIMSIRYATEGPVNANETSVTAVSFAYPRTLSSANQVDVYGENASREQFGFEKFTARYVGLSMKRLGTIGYLGIKEIEIYTLLAVENSNSTDTDLLLSGIWDATKFQEIDRQDITSYDLTKVDISSLQTKPATLNPNCLFIISDSNSPLAGQSNVILKDGDAYTASIITLTDSNEGEYPFNNAIGDISVQQVSYTRDFSAMTSDGWASVYFPFPVTKQSGWIVEEYTKYENEYVYFNETQSDQLVANKPYLIKLSDEFTITVSGYSFTAQSVSLPLSADTGYYGDSNYTLKGTYSKLSGDAITGALGLRNNGSSFATAGENAFVSPFRAYLDPVGEPGNARVFSIVHDGENDPTSIQTKAVEVVLTPVNGTLEILSTVAQSIRIYGIDGCVVFTAQLSEGINTINGLAKGVYLVNNTKIVIR